MPKKLVLLNSPTFNSGSFFTSLEDKYRVARYVHTLEHIKKDGRSEKRGRKPKPKIYFSHETELAIMLYNSVDDCDLKNKIYDEQIRYSFEKLAENIINTFSFDYIHENYMDIKAEVISHLLLNINKYDQAKGKAFSYFSVTAKNFLILWNREAHARYKDTRSIHQIQGEDSNNTTYDIVDTTHDDQLKNDDVSEFIYLMVEYFDSHIPLIFKKKRDIEIAYAINELFRNVDKMEFFNKKALYLLIREMTGHKTQYITKVSNIMQGMYDGIKHEYYASGKIETDTIFF